MIEMDQGRFEELVGEALDTIPDELAEQMDNVAVFVEDVGDDPHLLGLYTGVPLTERDGYGVYAVMPDRITIYRQPILAICSTDEDVIAQVRTTVVHEVAHHFGLDDQRLAELGWD